MAVASRPCRATGYCMFDLSLLRSRVIAGVVTIAASVAIAPPGAAESAGDLTSIPAIEEQLAALNLPARSIELTPEKAAHFRHQIEEGQYSAARDLIRQVLDDSNLQNWRFYPFEDFIAQTSNLTDPSFKEHLDTWVAQDDRDPLRVLVRAQYYYDLGWFQRSHKFIKYIETDHIAAFKNSMEKALSDVDAALRLTGTNPYSFYLKLRILQGMGASEQLLGSFQQAIEKYPDYYPMYDIVLRAMEPKWGGSVGAMYVFVDQYAGHAPTNSPLRLLYLSLYRDLIDTASIACRDYRNDREKATRCVRSSMDKFVTPELTDKVIGSLQLYDQKDHYQFGLVVEPILIEMLRTPNADAYSGTLLQLAATAMHSDTALKENNPEANDYVIDKAVAQSWVQRSVYESAAKKREEALKDTAHGGFPDEGARDEALGRIYKDMAWQAGWFHQYADLIAYETAAVRLGGPNDYEHAICYGLHQLKHETEAVSACSQAIADQPNDLYAFYWRGIARRALMQPDAALSDLAIVADSESDYRASAAITMSLIYFDRDDNAGALRVLNQYSYLYDSNIQDKATVATAYNNRCYAYMQLGDLEKAFNECTASLKYGSLPDAYRKQQELVKRLSPHGSNL